MSLASNYVAVLKDGTNLKQVVSYMIQRGHQSLLPQVLRLLQREKDEGETVTVAREADVARAKKVFPEATVAVDGKIVGGYVKRDGARLTDASFRKSLVELYKKTVHHG